MKENKADHEDKPVKTTDQDKQDDASHRDSKIDGSKLEQPASPKLNDIAKQDSSESDNDKLMIELDSL